MPHGIPTPDVTKTIVPEEADTIFPIYSEPGMRGGTTVEDMHSMTARDRYYTWHDQHARKMEAEARAHDEEVRHNFDCWLSGQPMVSTEYSWEINPSRFEIRLLNNLYGELSLLRSGIILDRAKAAGFKVIETDTSMMPALDGIPVAAIVCERIAREMPLTSARVRPMLARGKTGRFFERHRNWETKGPAMVSKEAPGLDRLAVCARALLETGACSRIGCELPSAEYLNEFRSQYSLAFEEAGLRVASKGSRLVIEGWIAFGDPHTTASLDFSEFLSSRQD